jgi:hypothetical protein
MFIIKSKASQAIEKIRRKQLFNKDQKGFRMKVTSDFVRLGIFRRYYIEYHKNGEIKRTIRFLLKRVHGTIKDFYPSGRIESELTCFLGFAHGAYRHYSGLGRLDMDARYLFGKLASKVRLYDRRNGCSASLEDRKGRKIWRDMARRMIQDHKTTQIKGEFSRKVDNHAFFRRYK